MVFSVGKLVVVGRPTGRVVGLGSDIRGPTGRSLPERGVGPQDGGSRIQHFGSHCKPNGCELVQYLISHILLLECLSATPPSPGAKPPFCDDYKALCRANVLPLHHP